MKNNQTSVQTNNQPQSHAFDYSIELDNQAFCQILAWLDAPATKEQLEGMQRLQTSHLPWSAT
jgi:hypothetical protein